MSTLEHGNSSGRSGSRISTGFHTYDGSFSIALSHDIVINGAGHLWPVEEPRAAAEVVTRNLAPSSVKSP